MTLAVWQDDIAAEEELSGDTVTCDNGAEGGATIYG